MSPNRVKAAAIGALSGVFAAVVGTIISIPLTLLVGNMAQQGIETLLENSDALQIEGLPRDLLESLTASGEGLVLNALLLSLVMSLLIYTLFAALGGILGASIFHKKA